MLQEWAPVGVALILVAIIAAVGAWREQVARRKAEYNETLERVRGYSEEELQTLQRVYQGVPRMIYLPETPLRLAYEQVTRERQENPPMAQIAHLDIMEVLAKPLRRDKTFKKGDVIACLAVAAFDTRESVPLILRGDDNAKGVCLSAFCAGRTREEVKAMLVSQVDNIFDAYETVEKD